MNILLRTNTSNPYLELRDVKLYKDGSGYYSYLVARSDAFSVEKQFYFEEYAFDQFLQQLIEMNQILTGKATLKPLYEPEYIMLEMLSRGHILVSGEFFGFDLAEQHLKFGFETDQTCLSPLIEDLKSCKKDA